MTEHWQAVDALFDAVVDLPAGPREAFLDRACADPAVRREVEALLAAEAQAQAWIEDPAALLPRLGTGDRPGDRLGAYRLVRVLGRGGMGAVYLAEQHDEGIRRRVALKLLDSRVDRPEIALRLRREGRVLAGLEHPNIARLYETGTTADGRPFLVMEYVDGLPLDTYCDRHRLGVDARVALFIKICDAVQFAHQRLLVHRDLKPDNIVVAGDGEPKLLDFGIAKPLEPLDDDPAPLTRNDARPMTPRYASPEQIRGQPVTTGSDVYALGVVLYELLSGRPPYRLDGCSAAAAERLICRQQPTRPSRAILQPASAPDGSSSASSALAHRRGAAAPVISRQLAGDLDTIVAMAMRKEPERRYPSAERLAEDLRRYRRKLPVSARRSTVGYRTGRFLQRHRWGSAVAMLLAIMVVGWALTWRHEAAKAARQRDLAETVSASLVGMFQIVDPSATRGDQITAHEVLDHGVARVRSDLADQPEAQARLLHAIGRVYLNLDLLSKAEPVLEDALARRRSLHGEHHPAVAENLLDLALLARKQNDFVGAESTVRRAIGLLEHDPAAHHGSLAEGLDLLTDLLAERAALEEAASVGAEALALRRRFGGRSDVGVSSSLALLAKVHELQGDFDAAERLARDATEHVVRVLGDDHPETIRIMQRLIGALYKGKQLDEAERWTRRMLAAQERVYGRGHRRLAEANNLLGVILAHQGNLEAAEAVEQEALEIAITWLGPDHGEITYYLSNLGKTLNQLGRPAEAEPLFRRAIAIARTSFPAGAPHVSNPLVGLAMALVDSGRAAEAEPLLREALALRRAAFPDGKGSQVARAEGELGVCLVALGRFDEARGLLASSLPVLTAIEGANSHLVHRTERARQALDRRSPAR